MLVYALRIPHRYLQVASIACNHKAGYHAFARSYQGELSHATLFNTVVVEQPRLLII